MTNIENVKDMIKDELGEGYNITTVNALKNNVELTGINIIKVGERISPTFYLDNEISDYENVRKIIRSYKKESLNETEDLYKEINLLYNWEYVKGTLRVRLMEANKNKKLKTTHLVPIC